MPSADSAPSDLPSPSDFLGPSFSDDSTSQVASPPSPPLSSDSLPPAPLIADAQSPSSLPASNEPPTPPPPALAPQGPAPPPPPAPSPQSPLLPPPPPSPTTAAPSPQPPPPPPPLTSPPRQPPSPSPSSNSPLPALPSPSPSPQGAPPTLTSSSKLPPHPAPPKVKEPPPSPSSSHNLASPPHFSASHISGGHVTGVVIGTVAVLAIFALLWVLFTRRKRRRDPYGIEGYYLPREAFSDGAAVSGRMSYPPSGEQFPYKHSLPPVEALPLPSMSNSAGFSSTPSQPLSTGGSGGVWPDSSGPANSFALVSSGIVLDSMKSAFTYEELSMATDGFSNLNLLGQGGFGYVHKGILPTGKIIAVKSLKAGVGQGDREFQGQVETISRAHHKHLVSLVGYCATGPQKLLVYEFVANRTLEFHLHGKGQPVMDWATRLKVAVGAAKGLAYLHEDCHPKIIHQDIKAANILLDFKFEAKVADSGLAKFTSHINTHISTRVMGNSGYLAPEYASSGKLTEKSDVFSFGVVLLELIRGRRPVDHSPHSRIENSLVDWARPLLSKAVQEGNFDALVDPQLKSNYNYEEMGCMITCAASCVRHSARRRPQMSQVVRALEGNLPLSHLNDGVKPGFSLLQGSTDIDNDQHKEELQVLGRTALSNEYSSGEFGRRTSEFSGYSK